MPILALAVRHLTSARTGRELDRVTLPPRFPSMIRLRAWILLVTLATLAACSSDSPTQASPFTGLYALELVDQQGLPFPHFFAPLTGDTLMLVDAEIGVLSRGRVRLVRWYRWHPTNAAPGALTSDTLVRDYREAGDLVLIDHPAMGAHAAFTDTVEVVPNTLVAIARLVPPPAYANTVPIRRTMTFARP